MSVLLPHINQQAVDQQGKFTPQVYDSLRRAFKALNDRQVALEDSQTAIAAILQSLGVEDVEALQAIGPLLESKQDASEILSQLAALAGYGFVTHAGQVFRARVLAGTTGQIDVANGNGFNAAPTFSLADVTDAGGGTLQKTAFDAKGRKTGTSAATTDNLTEGATNLYFTAKRVRDTVLTALSTATNAVITAADTVLSALGKLQAQVSANLVALGLKADKSITISTTAPLTGGGDLSANRTLAIPAATAAVAGHMTAAYASKLDGIATGATANATDAALRDRATHTGAQAQSTITGLDTSLAAKADLVSGKVPTSQLPAVAIGASFPAASQAAMLALTAEIGDVAIRSDLSNRKFMLFGDPTILGDWVAMDISGLPVDSVNGQEGVVVLGKADIGLPNVDDVSDANKPVSTAQAAADAALIIDSIADADTTHAPSRNSVFDALALKGGLGDTQTWTGANTFRNSGLNLVMEGAILGYSAVAYGTAAQCIFQAAGGTEAAPTAAGSGVSLGAFSWRGHNGTSFTGSKGFFQVVTAETWTGTANGTRIFFATTPIGSTTLTNRLEITAAGHCAPGQDNTQDLGEPAKRWAVVRAGTGTINTSDAREKTKVIPLTAAEIAAAKDLACEIGTYQFLASVAEKGDAARHHVGMTVQRCIELAKAHRLDPFRYGFICYDKWPKRVEPAEYETVEVEPAVTVDHPAIYERTQVYTADGEPERYADRLVSPAWTEVVTPAVTEQRIVREAVVHPAGDRYSFRMDQLMAFIARGFEARLAALEAP